MKKFKYLILGIIILIILIVGISFVSYGYVITQIFGNSEGKSEKFTSKVVSIEYNDGTDYITSMSLDYFNPGSTLTKIFTVKNDSDNDAVYSISLSNVHNDFERLDDLTYELIKDNVVISSGIFPTTDMTLLDNIAISKNTNQVYTLVIKYLNSEENQIVDMDKSINANIALF